MGLYAWSLGCSIKGSNIRSREGIKWSKNRICRQRTMKDADTDAAKRQLLLNISEILEQRGLISAEEKKRMRDIINMQIK